MKKHYLISLSLIIALFIPLIAFSDEEIAPYSYISTSENGRYYFKMIPKLMKWDDRDKGHGVAYKVENEKEIKLWKTDGWYAFSVFLSNDGNYLIRIGNWPRGHEPSNKDIAIAFYKKGIFLRSYSTKDLIKDIKKVPFSVSHYRFLKDKPKFEESYGTTFQLITVDDIKYIFDIQTGNIVTNEDIE